MAVSQMAFIVEVGRALLVLVVVKLPCHELAGDSILPGLAGLSTSFNAHLEFHSIVF